MPTGPRLLGYLATLPRWMVLVGTAAIVLLGLFVRGPVGAAALVVLAFLLGWLLEAGWPRLRPGERVLRMAVILVVLAGAGWQATR